MRLFITVSFTSDISRERAYLRRSLEAVIAQLVKQFAEPIHSDCAPTTDECVSGDCAICWDDVSIDTAVCPSLIAYSCPLYLCSFLWPDWAFVDRPVRLGGPFGQAIVGEGFDGHLTVTKGLRRWRLLRWTTGLSLARKDAYATGSSFERLWMQWRHDKRPVCARVAA